MTCFQTVQIDEEQTHRVVLALRNFERLTRELEEAAAIVEPCQLVDERQALQKLGVSPQGFLTFSVGDVGAVLMNGNLIAERSSTSWNGLRM